MKHKPLLISGLDLFARAFDTFNDNDLNEIDRSALYLVTWPEHVHSPRFNGDCDYSEQPSTAYSLESDIEGMDIYADSDTWNMLPWFSTEFLANRMH